MLLAQGENTDLRPPQDNFMVAVVKMTPNPSLKIALGASIGHSLVKSFCCLSQDY